LCRSPRLADVSQASKPFAQRFSDRASECLAGLLSDFSRQLDLPADIATMPNLEDRHLPTYVIDE
jgi:hypothetical protein